MRRFTFALMGVIACVLSVSCEDKLQTDEKKNSGQSGEGDSYKSLLDSAFYYDDGMLYQEVRKIYDQNGRVEKGITIDYDSLGSPNATVEEAYTYSDKEGNNYVLVTTKNGVEVERQEKSYSGTDGNYVSDTKTYVKHGEGWFLRNRTYLKSENYKSRGYNVQYAIYNGQSVVVNRTDLINQSDPVTKISLDMERITYRISFKKDPSDPDGLTISNLGSEGWVKTIRRCKSNGDVLFSQNLISEDSITWSDMGVYEYEYDRNGNLIYSESSVGGKIESKEYVTYSDDNRFLSSYEYSWDKNGTDSVLDYSTVYYYSESGRLDSAVIFSESRLVWSLPLNLRDITKGYNYGQGHNGLTGSKCVVLFDSKGNPVTEALYRMNDNGDIEGEAYVRSTLTYDSFGNCTGFAVSQNDEGEWTEIETQSNAYDSQGREVSSHTRYNGQTKSVNKLDPERYTITTTDYEYSTRTDYDSFGNESYKMVVYRNHVVYTFSDGRAPEEENVDDREEKYYSTRMVK